MQKRTHREQEPGRPAMRSFPEPKIIDLDKEPISSLSGLSQGTAEEEPFEIEKELYETEEESLETKTSQKLSPGKKPFHIYFHLIFLAVAVCTVFLVGWRITHFGSWADPDEYEAPEFQGDTMDAIFPFRLPEGMVNPADDGVTRIVAFGNAPFADDKGSKDNLASMIEDLTDSTVYNCTFPNSYLAASGNPLLYSPQDAFNFYWMVLALTTHEVDPTYETLFQDEGNHFSEEDLETFRTLMSIDFNTVDIIVILYDASDYLAGHEMYNDANDSDIKQFTGNLVPGIDLLRQYYPHIQIIVMSPPYAHAVNEKGEYVSSESYRYGWDTLSTYMIKEGEYVYQRGISFVDNLYGTIDESNADKYLVDNLHLTIEGRKAIAERFADVLHYYDRVYSTEEE